MTCPNCREPVEEGALYCGNCGHRMSLAEPRVTDKAEDIETKDAEVTETPQDLPDYTVPDDDTQSKHFRATMGIIFGLVGIVGALFLPLSGLVLGAAGLVFATMSLRTSKRTLSIISLIIASIAVIAGIASWVYAINQQANTKAKASKVVSATNSAPIISASSIKTPCYTIKFLNKINIENPENTCNLNAFNGASFSVSTEAYKVYATTSNVLGVNFSSLAKQAVEKDVKQSLPTFKIVHEEAGTFAASPAYFVTANNGAGVSVVEAAVFHQTSNPENFFVVVHAVGGSSVDLNDLQLGWQWL